MRHAHYFALVSALVSLLIGTAALSGELQRVDVEHNEPRYRVEMTALLEISQPQAWAVLTDFEQLERINPSIRRSDVTTRHADGASLHSVVRMCVLWMCKDIDQQQRMTIREEQANSGWLTAEVDPQHSDLRYGHGSWRLTATANGQTQLEFSAEIEPDFWVPPVIGPWLIKRALVREGEATVAGLEHAVENSSQESSPAND